MNTFIRRNIKYLNFKDKLRFNISNPIHVSKIQSSSFFTNNKNLLMSNSDTTIQFYKIKNNTFCKNEPNKDDKNKPEKDDKNKPDSNDKKESKGVEDKEKKNGNFIYY